MSDVGTMKKVKPQLSCEIITVNKTVAKHLLATSTFPLQRPLSDRNIIRLADEMRRGWYIQGTPLFFAVLPNKEQYLLNGHHSLEAVAETGVTMPFTAIYHPVKDMAEAGHLYSRFDIHKRRTWGDAFRAAGFESKVTFDMGWLARFGSAVRAIVASFEHPRAEDPLLSSREAMLSIAESYLPYGESYVDSMAFKHGRHSNYWRRAHVMAVGLELFKYQPKEAAKFFRGASGDSGLERTDPRKVLLQYLHDNSSYSSTDQKNMSIAVMLCWNAWHGKRDMAMLKVNAVSEFRLAGTPWKKDYDPIPALFTEVTAKSGGKVTYEGFTTGELTTKTGERVPVTQAV